VAAAIRMLGDELRRAMQLLGVTSIRELREQGPDLVRDVGERVQPQTEVMA
jgi:isopentenyl diphosphate isomerase/L-lactate dehydrogenase-like FMN-dependent dehydrogenase